MFSTSWRSVGETSSTGALQGGASSPRPSRITCARSAGVSRSARETASSTSSDARTSRPCSSHVYQVVPDPGEQGDLLAAQTGCAPPAAVGQADVVGLQAGALGAQEIGQLGAPAIAVGAARAIAVG